MSITFLCTALVIVLLPGSGSLYVVSAGLVRGRRAALLAAFAATIGTLPHLFLALSGLAALLHAQPRLYGSLTYLGAAYLLYLAWSTWRDRSPLTPAAGASPAAAPSTGHVLRGGVVVNLLNPKLTTFFVAFLPQFVPPDGPHPTLTMAGLGAVFIGMTYVVFVGYGLGADALRAQVLTRPRVERSLRRVFALSFMALGLRLVTEAR